MVYNKKEAMKWLIILSLVVIGFLSGTVFYLINRIQAQQLTTPLTTPSVVRDEVDTVTSQEELFDMDLEDLLIEGEPSTLSENEPIESRSVRKGENTSPSPLRPPFDRQPARVEDVAVAKSVEEAAAHEGPTIINREKPAS